MFIPRDALGPVAIVNLSELVGESEVERCYILRAMLFSPAPGIIGLSWPGTRLDGPHSLLHVFSRPSPRDPILYHCSVFHMSSVASSDARALNYSHLMHRIRTDAYNLLGAFGPDTMTWMFLEI